METVSKETIDQVRAKTGLDEKTIRRAVDAIKDWLLQQPHLPHQYDEGQLERLFLRCKKSVERAKNVLDMYYTLRTALPEIFSNRDPAQEWFKKITSVRIFLPLPQLTEEFERVTISAITDRDPDKYSVYDAVKLLFMTLDVRMREDYYTSDVIIMDVNNFTIAHAVKYTIPIWKKIEVCGLRGFNSRLKAIHVINAGTYLDTTINMVKSLLKPKIAARIYAHRKGSESLKQHVPLKILPLEYGGEAGRMSDLWATWVKKLESNREWFLEQENLKSDESKRPGENIDTGELFGFQGSFRRLSLD
ncbi:retinol-binding protein pinta-like [Zootermopsis nevadensis]|uniref:Alpha-tocopherol transfer protein-like n=1 Tax=Zootermopsis nevadensis TaxID=136037 RepID=A0A067RGV3_ZOONE|nr:retinol-binding protein pinta-like [Zootermopsis nevadensis]KDR19513.1 Alpha-tocopherol transfer protein-like [Zootermopsis nevadensis]